MFAAGKLDRINAYGTPIKEERCFGDASILAASQQKVQRYS
jgi:hypothetical protein